MIHPANRTDPIGPLEAPGSPPWSIRLTAALLWLGLVVVAASGVFMVIRLDIQGGFEWALFGCASLFLLMLAAVFAMGAIALPKTGNVAGVRILGVVCAGPSATGLSFGIFKGMDSPDAPITLAVLAAVLAYGFALLLLPRFGGGLPWSQRQMAFLEWQAKQRQQGSAPH